MNLPLKKRIIKSKKSNKNDTNVYKKLKNVEYLKKNLINANLDKKSKKKLSSYDYTIISYLMLSYMRLCNYQSKEIKKYIYYLLDKTIENEYGKEIKENIHKCANKIIYSIIKNYLHS